MSEPREPDRFDKQARDIASPYSDVLKSEAKELVRAIAAALRAAESSALERAAQHFTHRQCMAGGVFGFIDRSDVVAELRALIPPAAAPAAEARCRSGYVCQHCGCEVPENAPCPHCRDGVLREEKWTCRVAPPQDPPAP